MADPFEGWTIRDKATGASMPLAEFFANDERHARQLAKQRARLASLPTKPTVEEWEAGLKDGSLIPDHDDPGYDAFVTYRVRRIMARVDARIQEFGLEGPP